MRCFTRNKQHFSYFFALHLLAFFLLISLFTFEWSQDMWRRLDIWSFHIMNSSVLGHPLLQTFWSLANIKITDLYGAFFFLFSFLLFVFETKNSKVRYLRLGYMIFTLVWFEVSILFTKQLLTPLCEYFHISRHSPTVVLQDVIRLSSYLPWTKIKDISHFSFPSDHAVIVFQWCVFFSYFAGIARGSIVSLFSLIFLLPRLISGAHWLSDVMVGSCTIVMIAFAWATQSKLYFILMNFIQKKILRFTDWQSYEDSSQF